MDDFYNVYVPRTKNRCYFSDRLYALSLAQDCAIAGYNTYVFVQHEDAETAHSLYYYSASQPNYLYNVPNKYVMDDHGVHMN